MVDATFKVTGTFGTFDGAARDRAMRRRVLGVWRFAWVGLIITFIVLVGFTTWLSNAVDPKIPGGQGFVFVAGFVVSILCVTGLFHLVAWAETYRWYARGVPRHVTSTFTVKPEGLHISSELSNSVVFWVTFSEVALTGEYWLLINAGSAYFIPRVFFASAADERAFIADVLNHLSSTAQARSKSAYKALAALTAS